MNKVIVKITARKAEIEILNQIGRFTGFTIRFEHGYTDIRMEPSGFCPDISGERLEEAASSFALLSTILQGLAQTEMKPEKVRAYFLFRLDINIPALKEVIVDATAIGL